MSKWTWRKMYKFGFRHAQRSNIRHKIFAWGLIFSVSAYVTSCARAERCCLGRTLFGRYGCSLAHERHRQSQKRHPTNYRERIMGLPCCSWACPRRLHLKLGSPAVTAQSIACDNQLRENKTKHINLHYIPLV